MSGNKTMTIEQLFEDIDETIEAFKNSLRDHENIFFENLKHEEFSKCLANFNSYVTDIVREMMMEVAEKKIIFEIDKKKKIEGTK